jgi:hypothetical protein
MTFSINLALTLATALALQLAEIKAPFRRRKIFGMGYGKNDSAG